MRRSADEALVYFAVADLYANAAVRAGAAVWNLSANADLRLSSLGLCRVCAEKPLFFYDKKWRLDRAVVGSERSTFPMYHGHQEKRTEIVLSPVRQQRNLPMPENDVRCALATGVDFPSPLKAPTMIGEQCQVKGRSLLKVDQPLGQIA